MANAGSFHVKPGTTPARDAFGDRLATKHAAPLWNVLGDIVPHEPHPASVPALWRYDEMRPLLMEAGTLITAAEAERRVLMLENPGLRGASRITQSLYAGLQLIMPGEFAPGHRHTASALRLILEGECAYTSVGHERVTMRFGDLILTPSWSAHAHGNPGDVPVIWMDGLDIPIVNAFDAGFADHGVAEDGFAVPPLPSPGIQGPAPTRISYPYAESRAHLDEIRRSRPINPYHGFRLLFTDPVTGGELMRTLGAALQLLPSGFRGAPHRSTDSTVYCALEGSGTSRIGSDSLEWRARDIFVVPSWYPVAHAVDFDAVLFSFSDRPIQQALGFWREATG